jgi:hypothetical protein
MLLSFDGYFYFFIFTLFTILKTCIHSRVCVSFKMAPPVSRICKRAKCSGGMWTSYRAPHQKALVWSTALAESMKWGIMSDKVKFEDVRREVKSMA